MRNRVSDELGAPIAAKPSLLKSRAEAKVTAVKNFQESSLFALIAAAGWPAYPLLIASIIAVALIIERLIMLRKEKIVPGDLLGKVVNAYRQQGVNPQMLEQLAKDSPLGQVLAAGLRNHKSSRYVMKEAIEEAGHAVSHGLERFLTTLGTLATIAPLMGLFGTVVGMIEIFGSQTSAGGATGGNPAQLAHGISVALYNTGFGLAIAMPALVFYRHFRALVDGFIIDEGR